MNSNLSTLEFESPLMSSNPQQKAKEIQAKRPFLQKLLFQPGYQSLVFSSILLLFLYVYVIVNFKAFLYVDPVITMQFIALFILAIVSHGTIAISLQTDTGTTLSHWFY